MDRSTADNPQGRSGALEMAAVPGALATVGLMLHVVAHAVGRSLGEPITGTLEVTAFWYMPAIVFFGLVLAQRAHEHVEAELAYNAMPTTVKRDVRLLGVVLTLALCVVWGWFGLQYALNEMAIGLTSGVSQVVIWPPMFLVPIGFLLFSIQLLIDLFRELRDSFGSGSPSRSSTDREHEPAEIAHPSDVPGAPTL